MAESTLPPLTQYPPENIKQSLQPREWQDCLDAWISSVESRLRISEADFKRFSPELVGLPFLLSFLASSDAALNASSADPKQRSLRQVCYALTKRLLRAICDKLQPLDLFEVLSSGSIAFGQVKDWKVTLKSTWSEHQIKARKAIEVAKSSLVSSGTSETQLNGLRKLSALTKMLPETALVTVAGADYLDTLMSLYTHGATQMQKATTENIFYSFRALLELRKTSVLTDNIYHMKSEADRLQNSGSTEPTLLSSLLCTTSFYRHFVSSPEIATKQQKLVDQLKVLQQHMSHLHPMPVDRKSKASRGKAVASSDADMHMHKAAQISQIHELFPHLNTAYIMKALDHYQDNVEDVIAALLEPESLPQDLQDQESSQFDSKIVDGALDDLAPRTTPPPPPPSIRNHAFGDDEFDRLQISADKLRRGKKDLVLEDQPDEHSRSKAAILSALAAFDSDDDERDDTYDIADVGGAVDNTVDTDSRPRQPGGQEASPTEAVFFKAWKENPELFARDSKTRASNIRVQLKRELNVTDEQIEGWAIMLKKDPKMEARLSQKYSAVRAFAGNQANIRTTKWSAGTSTENSETESGAETKEDDRRMGQAGIRGHRHFGRGRGRGGSTSGPADDATTLAARRRKEQGRGRGGANHRRDARAKKIGRGMGPLPT